jgi:hypothetical protein
VTADVEQATTWLVAREIPKGAAEGLDAPARLLLVTLVSNLLVRLNQDRGRRLGILAHQPAAEAANDWSAVSIGQACAGEQLVRLEVCNAVSLREQLPGIPGAAQVARHTLQVILELERVDFPTGHVSHLMRSGVTRQAKAEPGTSAETRS